MRVKVYDTDGKFLETGTITKIEPLDIEYEDGTLERILEKYPAEIKLDSGGILEGLSCWWIPL